MYLYTQGKSRIVGTGIYLPEQRVTTRELMQAFDSKARFGVPDEWLERVTGIKEKRVTPPGILPSDMAVTAAKEAMERAEITTPELDAIIYTGLTRDHVEPATAHIVQAKLGAANAAVFDICNACHGFMNGIHVMDALIATGQVRHGLVVTGEKGSVITQKAIEALKDANDRAQFISLAAALTVGDAGAAMVLGPKKAPDSGLIGLMLQSRGQHANLCAYGSITEEGMFADMPAMVTASIKMAVPMFRDFLYERLKWSISDISKYILHQTGRKTFKLHTEFGGIPASIMPNTITTLGNLITATIPLNLHIVFMKKEIRQHDKIFLSGFGSGISMSQAGLIWDVA